MKTWTDGVVEAIGQLTVDTIVPTDHLKNLRHLYDGYMTDDVDYEELGLCALEGLRSVSPSHPDILAETRDLLVDKQHDYGNENIVRFGHGGIGIRINDKICRLENLATKDHHAVEETIEETWQDVLGYCIIGIMMHNETFSLPLIGTRHAAMLKRQPDWHYTDTIYR